MARIKLTESQLTSIVKNVLNEMRPQLVALGQGGVRERQQRKKEELQRRVWEANQQLQNAINGGDMKLALVFCQRLYQVLQVGQKQGGNQNYQQQNWNGQQVGQKQGGNQNYQQGNWNGQQINPQEQQITNQAYQQGNWGGNQPSPNSSTSAVNAYQQGNWNGQQINPQEQQITNQAYQQGNWTGNQPSSTPYPG